MLSSNVRLCRFKIQEAFRGNEVVFHAGLIEDSLYLSAQTAEHRIASAVSLSRREQNNSPTNSEPN